MLKENQKDAVVCFALALITQIIQPWLVLVSTG